MERAKGKKINVVASQRELPVLLDEDITESFIRGSGPGGQKINKTSNRVLLVHEPTQIRVECQDTRSLQQNRKIAKKRLQLKLDDYLNGSQSRGSLAAEKASTKKSKTKARSRARQRQKKEAGGQTNVPSFEEEEEF
jgi:protein subunit release factor B